MLLETIFQYRTLIGKCELGCGLDWEEIEQVTQIEHAFVADSGRSGRRFKRTEVELTGILRGDRVNDRVRVVEIGPGGLVALGAPYIARGSHIEVVIDSNRRSYRIGARGIWLKDDGDDYKIGLAFVGVPICLHVVASTAHESDVVDRLEQKLKLHEAA